MKKLIAMLLALVMVIGLVACGAPEVNEPVEETPAVVEPVPEETEAPIEETEAPIEETEAPVEEETEVPSEEVVDPTIESETEAPVEEVPTDDTLDTVESVISKNFTNYKLAVYFENNAYCVDILESDQANNANVADLVKFTAVELYRAFSVEKVIITLYDNNEIIVSSEATEQN